MLVLETVAKIGRAHFVQGKGIKAIWRELHVSRKGVRKVLRSEASQFRFEREEQPLPQISPCQGELFKMPEANESKPSRERLTLMRIFEELRQRGFEGSYDLVHRYARSWQRDPASTAVDAFVPLRNPRDHEHPEALRHEGGVRRDHHHGGQATARAKLLLAEDIGEFQFARTPINDMLVRDLAGGNFLAHQRNVVLVGRAGTGKKHLAIAMARALIRDGKRGRFFNVVDLVKWLEAEGRTGRQGRMAEYLCRMDFVVLDEVGYLSFAQSGGQLLFNLISPRVSGGSPTRDFPAMRCSRQRIKHPIRVSGTFARRRLCEVFTTHTVALAHCCQHCLRFCSDA